MAQSATTETDSDVAYTPDYTDTERVDVGAALETKAITEIGMEVDELEAHGGLAVLLRLHGDTLRGKFLIEPDRAEWLGRRLIEAADD